MKTFEQPYLTVIPIGSDKPPKNLDTILTWFLEKNGVKIDQKTMKNDVKEYRKLSHDLRKMAKGSDLDFVDLSVIEAQNPSIDFRRVANSFINPGRKILENKIKERIEAIENPAFIDEKHRLEKIISKAGPRAVANYLIIFYVDQTIGRLQDLAEETCIELILNYLPNPALRVFIRNYFKKENLEIVSGMIEENREIFKEMLRESTWLHEETKKNAILKLEKMGKMVGYPEEFEAEGALDKTYETLNLLEDESLYTTIRKLNKFNMEQTMEYVALESPLDPDPEASLIQVNAFYSQLSNSLTILAPFIDDPLFDATFPKYAKIAGIGNTVAHQIGHGYDPEGRLADETGEEKDWWTPEDTVEYEKRTQCMIDQYDNYDDPEYGKNLNGSVTINEMVADNIGVEVSWNAFKKLDLSKEPRIVGFGNYSIPKLYFRISALEFCRARDDSPDLVKELTRHHPTDSFRVNGVFSNMKQFADTFNCPVGSPMNPETKCVLF
uniref:Peptidase_M13 domain-containing protein n=2 Tax=Caenorhabditis tropicalis TaxID=1561998 RepID=A0A1I7UKQ4_9PELO